MYSLQGTKGMYSSIEIGITANSRDNDLTMWADEVTIQRMNLLKFHSLVNVRMQFYILLLIRLQSGRLLPTTNYRLN